MNYFEELLLPSFLLKSLYHTSSDGLQFLKELSKDNEIVKYLDSLIYYVGKKNAYLIKQKNHYLGFLMIANYYYGNSDENNLELYIAISKDYRNHGVASQVVEEISNWLFSYSNVDHIYISIYNPKMNKIIEELGFNTIDGKKYVKENPNVSFKI